MSCKNQLHLLANEVTTISDLQIAHSGRVDFFKQTLTLSLAGIAGFAVLLVNPDNTPESPMAYWSVVTAGTSLLSSAGGAMAGLSVYANLLHRQAEKGDITEFADGLVNHAKWCFASLSVAALAVALFGASHLLPKDGDAEQEASGKDIDASVAITIEDITPKAVCHEVSDPQPPCARTKHIEVECENNDSQTQKTDVVISCIPTSPK